MRRVQKTDDVVAVVERIIVGKVHSKSEGKDFTFPYDLRARLRAETDGQKETHFRARIRTFFSLSLSSSAFRATFHTTYY